MIKRRFYKVEHGDISGTSESSSSDDSDSFNEVDAEEGRDVEDEEGRRGGDKNILLHRSPGSGYESEDSSNNQGDVDTSEILINEEDMTGDNMKGSKMVDKVPGNEVEMAHEMTGRKIHPIQTNISNFILKFKSVFKCRLCPRILCLNEDAVGAHLSSKRHAGSKKLHDEGRLKLMLNSDGELEEEQETHAERHARILALSERVCTTSNNGKSEPSIKNCSKKRRTVDT
ncbi:uncharacterized protein LOC110032293 isoform X1 [Phalaenopsis equestris]|uniref:uncharacterized protein LOC110032293 isoform X1 n=1 Tax=Phalaenopsis equestris TaxID=78828 RepID=UPI0009E1C453|nr:uncharacterized protein LOC110032293 isoform X1 [Phalaenopsis equestris]